MQTHTEQHGNVEVGVVEHEGREYRALGAVVTENTIAAYLGKDGQLTNWGGEVIGTYRITASWYTPRSFVSSRMFQVRATVNGVTYTGRSAGVGMLYRGRRVKESAL